MAGSDDWQVGKEYGEMESPEPVSKNGLFEPFTFKNAFFTKTGSGQT